MSRDERRLAARAYGPIHMADDNGDRSRCGVRYPKNWMTEDGSKGIAYHTWLCGNCWRPRYVNSSNRKEPK